MKQQRQRRNSHFLFWQIFFSLLSDPPHSPPPPLWIRFLPRFGIWRQHSGGVIWQCRLSKSTGTLSWAPFLFGEHIRIQGLFPGSGPKPIIIIHEDTPQRPHTTHDILKSIPHPPTPRSGPDKDLHPPTFFWQSDFGLQITQASQRRKEKQQKRTKK